MPYEAFRREADGTFGSSGLGLSAPHTATSSTGRKNTPGPPVLPIDRISGFGMFNFNPVPYAAGESSTYSVWLKSDREMPVALSLYICNGSALSRTSP